MRWDFNLDRCSVCKCSSANCIRWNGWAFRWRGSLSVYSSFFPGAGKLFVPERREQMRQTLIGAHIPFPDFNTFLVSTVEFVCGLLLVIGALTPLACALLGCVMIMAIATAAIRNIKASCALGWLAEFLYLPEVLYLVILVWLFFSGPGWLSVDQLILSQIRV
jgi:putative oxidoreductase